MNKKFLKIAILLISLFVFTSCEEKIIYGWGEINESLGLVQYCREELKDEISDLEHKGYDTSDLEEIDEQLSKVERILDSKFNF